MATSSSSNNSQTVTVNVGTLTQAIAVAIQEATSSNSERNRPQTTSHNASHSQTGPGRPPVVVDIINVQELRNLNYNWKQIAEMLGMSRATLYRKLREQGVTTYTSLTSQEVDNIVSSVKQDHPNDGEVLLQGHLRSRNIRISRQSLRNSVHRVDSTGVADRRRNAIRWRIYSVPYPNYVWHIDGHHKLIKWRFVIHGAIDGFSRIITYLHCSDNNRASTVLEKFLGAVELFRLPERVRTDHGGENIEVWKQMIASHHFNYSSVITGSSVHNERVERLWRDVNRTVCQQFSHIFRELENDGRLDSLNEVDIYWLHYVFLPKINLCLRQFKESWNNHNMSTEGGKTPYQLYLEGMNYMTSIHNITPGLNVDSVDVATLCSQEENVTVPRLSFQPCTLLLQQIDLFSAAVSPSGRTTFENIIDIAGQHLLLCSDCAC